MKTEKEIWGDNVLKCAVNIMKQMETYSPREVLPALVACIQATITLCAKDGVHASDMIELIKRKLDQYDDEHENIVALWKSLPEGMEQ